MTCDEGGLLASVCGSDWHSREAFEYAAKQGWITTEQAEMEAEERRKRCYACDKLHASVEYVLTEDGAQTVPVGPSCYAKVRKLDKHGGYQPPRGGPRLFLIGSKG
jgi:hypothetical protein